MKKYYSPATMQSWASTVSLQMPTIPNLWLETLTHFFVRCNTLQLNMETASHAFADLDEGYGYLSNCFPVLKHAIGDEFFTHLSTAYLESVNAIDFSGNCFSEFLQATRPDKDDPYSRRERWPDFIIELAKLECTFCTLSGTEPHTVFPTAYLSTPDDVLQLSGSLQLFHFHFPVHKYYKSVIDNEQQELPMPRESFIAVFRKEGSIGVIGLRPFEYIFLQQLQKGITISEAIDFMATVPNMDKEKALSFWGTCRSEWISWGFFNID